MYPFIIYTAGVVNGIVENNQKKVDAKYKYGFLANASVLQLARTTTPKEAGVKLPFGMHFGVSCFVTGMIFCMGHMTSRMIKDI